MENLAGHVAPQVNAHDEHACMYMYIPMYIMYMAFCQRERFVVAIVPKSALVVVLSRTLVTIIFFQKSAYECVIGGALTWVR